MLHSVLLFLARTIALSIGAFTLINLVGESAIGKFDATIWWLDMQGVPSLLVLIFQTTFSIVMTWFGLFGSHSNERLSRMLCTVTGIMALVAATIAAVNSMMFFRLVGSQQIFPSTDIPFSLIVAMALVLVASVAFLRNYRHSTTKNNSTQHTSAGALTFGVLTILALFPLLLIHFYGSTDYRRSADVAIVFGARAYADGHPSTPLADRVQHACTLYTQGFVNRLIFSGGPGDGAVHETQAMKALALSLGVDTGDIILDSNGHSTQETVRNSVALLDSIGAHSIIAVSHQYHLPRIKMTFQRKGISVYTSPAPDRSRHGRAPGQLAREVIAFWVYYMRPFAGKA